MSCLTADIDPAASGKGTTVLVDPTKFEESVHKSEVQVLYLEETKAHEGFSRKRTKSGSPSRKRGKMEFVKSEFSGAVQFTGSGVFQVPNLESVMAKPPEEVADKWLKYLLEE